MLALVGRDHFHGIIGTETGTIVNDVEVCVGDVVRVAKGSNNSECTNVVGIFTDKFAVMGLAADPISHYNILEIVHSHEELTEGCEFMQGYLKVKAFKE